MKTRRNRRAVAALCALALALLMEILPGGVTMRFAAGPGAYFLKTCSFFDLTPMGYGDPLPMAAGILTVAAAALVLTGFSDNGQGRRRGAALVVTVLACLAAMLQLVLFGEMNGMGLAVAVLLAASGALQGLSVSDTGKK